MWDKRFQFLPSIHTFLFCTFFCLNCGKMPECGDDSRAEEIHVKAALLCVIISRTCMCRAFRFWEFAFSFQSRPATHSDTWGSTLQLWFQRKAGGPLLSWSLAPPLAPVWLPAWGLGFWYNGTFRLSLTWNLNFSRWFSRALQSSEGLIVVKVSNKRAIKLCTSCPINLEVSACIHNSSLLHIHSAQDAACSKQSVRVGPEMPATRRGPWGRGLWSGPWKPGCCSVINCSGGLFPKDWASVMVLWAIQTSSWKVLFPPRNCSTLPCRQC